MPKKTYKITLIHLSKEISMEDLRLIFREFGEISKIQIKKESLQFNKADVFFTKENSAQLAREKDNTYYKSHLLTLAQPVPKKQQPANSDEEANYNDFLQDYRQYFKPSSRPRHGEEVDISEMLAKANNLYLSSDHSEAIELLHDIITLAPELQEPYQILSLIYEEKGDISNAISFLMLAAQLSQGESEIWVKSANLNKQIKNIQQAEYCITRAVKLDKTNVYYLFERGNLQEEMGNYRKAASIYEKILRYNSNQEILLLITNIYERLKAYDKAITVLETHHQNIQRKMKILIKLYDLYLLKPKYQAGIDFFNTFSSYEGYFNSSSLRVRYLLCLLSTCIEDQTNLDNILKEIKTEFNSLFSDELCADNETALIHKLFEILQLMDRIDKFVQIYEEMEENIKNVSFLSIGIGNQLNQLNPEIYIKIAEHYFNLQNYTSAIVFYNKSLALSKNVLIRVKLSEIYSLIGDNKLAVDILNDKDINGPPAFKQECDKMEDNDMLDSEMNPFGENLQRDFIQHQLNDEDDNIQNESLNTLIQQNSNKFIPINFEKESSENFLTNKTYSYPKVLIKLTGKKRIRLCTNFKSHKSSAANYNFEAYLKRRNINPIDSQKAKMTTLSALKMEYDELTAEVNNSNALYLKLQQSVYHLTDGQYDKFLENTYAPLKNILLQQLKIEEYKTYLFNFILDKSHIKNFFKTNDTIFDQDGVNFQLGELDEQNLDESLISDALNLSKGHSDEFNKKDTLFLRKSHSRNLLSKKKVAKTVELVEKQFVKLKPDKLINSENYFMVIENYIAMAYNIGKYYEVEEIISLFMSTENFKQRNDRLAFNVHLYSILTSFKLKNYRYSFEQLKQILIHFDLKDSPFFWIMLNTIGKEMGTSTLRSYLYKMTINPNLTDNIFLSVQKANCYFQTGYWYLSLRILDGLIKKDQQVPYFLLVKGLNELFNGMSRKTKFKENHFVLANASINHYAMKRMRKNPLETMFNLGRYYQFIGHDREALKWYDEIYAKMMTSRVMFGEEKEKLFQGCLYNKSIILKRGGMDEEAHKLIMENIIIE